MGSTLMASAVQVKDQAGRMLMVRTEGRKHWTLPGGQALVGEAPTDCARREFFEETGLRVRLLRVRALHYITAPVASRVFGGSSDVAAMFYTGKLEPGSDPAHLVLQAGEIAEAGWMPLNEAKERADYLNAAVLNALAFFDHFVCLEDGTVKLL